MEEVDEYDAPRDLIETVAAVAVGDDRDLVSVTLYAVRVRARTRDNPAVRQTTPVGSTRFLVMRHLRTTSGPRPCAGRHSG